MADDSDDKPNRVKESREEALERLRTRPTPRCWRFPGRTPVCGCTIPCATTRRLGTPLDEVVDGLFVSPMETAYDALRLVDAGITAVVDASDSEYTRETGLFQYCRLALQDDPDENIFDAFAGVADLVSEARAAGGAVLIHCQKGVSRSCTLVAACLLRDDMRGSSTDEVLAHIVARHPDSKPNAGFELQLRSWEASLDDSHPL